MDIIYGRGSVRESDVAVCKNCQEKFSRSCKYADNDNDFCGMCRIECDEDGCTETMHIDVVDASRFCFDCGAVLCDMCLESHKCV